MIKLEYQKYFYHALCRGVCTNARPECILFIELRKDIRCKLEMYVNHVEDGARTKKCARAVVFDVRVLILNHSDMCKTRPKF